MGKLGGKNTVPPLRNPVDWIRFEYSSRRAKNPLYSLRAFARHLAMGSGPLSEILLSKRTLTKKQALRIAERLGYSPSDTQKFVQVVEGSKVQKKAEATDSAYLALNEDVFQVVADWFHYAIRELVGTEGFREDPQWIARRLGLSTTEVRGAWERLVRLGLIKKTKRGWVAVDKVTTTHDVPSSAIRKFHEQAILRSVEKLRDVPTELRDITSITVSTDPELLAEAKAEIKKFRRKLALLLERGKKTEVYQLNIQLVPLTKKEIRDGSSH